MGGRLMAGDPIVPALSGYSSSVDSVPNQPLHFYAPRNRDDTTRSQFERVLYIGFPAAVPHILNFALPPAWSCYSFPFLFQSSPRPLRLWLSASYLSVS